MWPALISAGATLFGSLFGSGSRKQETVSRVDYKRMVRDAEAAGFNPLTALRNGGAAGFSISTTPAAPLSARLADGLSAGVSNFLANFDPMADDKREAEFQLVQAQIQNLNASAAAMESQSFNVPGYGAGTIERRPSGTAGQLSKALPPSAGASLTPTVETPTVTNPFPTASGWQVDPNLPDAEAAQTRYGDLVGAVFGVYNAVNDWDRNTKAKADKDWQEVIDNSSLKYWQKYQTGGRF